MKQRIFERIKNYFSFLSFTDKQLMSIVDKVFDNEKTEEENYEQIVAIFYSIVKDSVEKKDVSLLLSANNFNYSDTKTAIKSLNEFAIFLSKCGIDFNKDLERRIKIVNSDLDKVLKKVSESSNIDMDELNSLAIELIESSSFSLSEKIDEELDDEKEDINSFENISFTDDSTKQYLKEIGKIPLLTPEEEQTIYKEYKITKDPKLRKRIIEANLRLVVSIAGKYQRKTNMSLLDLISVGNEGIIRAIEDYDPEKSKFSTYATTWIRQKILRELENSVAPLRIPANLRNEVVRFHKLKSELESQRGKKVSHEELRDITGLPLKKIKEYEKIYIQMKPVSMDSPVGDDEDAKFSDFVVDDNTRTPEDAAIFNDYSRVNLLLSHLTETERIVMELKSGIYDGREYKLEEISSKLIELGLRQEPVSRQRIEQIEKKARKRLRNIVEREKKLADDPRLAARRRVIEDINRIEQNNKINMEFMRLVKLIRVTEVTVLTRTYAELPKNIKQNLMVCFGNNIYSGNVQNPTFEDKKEAVYVSLPYLKRMIEKNLMKEVEQNIDKVDLPRNLYDYFSDYSSFDVDKAISELSATERLTLSKTYDLFDGNYRMDSRTSFVDAKLTLNIIDMVRFNLPKSKGKRKIN